MAHRDEPLDDLVAALRVMGTKKATPERRAFVRQALASKYEGAQSVAAQVLGSWGGRESVADLREWLAQLDHYGTRGVAVKALARCVGSEDVDWVLDLYFEQKSVLAMHEYLELACVLDPTLARPRVVAELRAHSAVRRSGAVKLVSSLACPDTAELVRPLLTDSDKFTREVASVALRRSRRADD